MIPRARMQRRWGKMAMTPKRRALPATWIRFLTLYIGFAVMVAARLQPVDEMAAQPIIERAD
jgi:hypothetical protein